jgi:hypothetical protein
MPSTCPSIYIHPSIHLYPYPYPNPHRNPARSYACSSDGMSWEPGQRVAVPGGSRTPFGLVPMTSAEVSLRTADILAYGVLNQTQQLHAPNTTLSWLFYTVTEGGWEVFRSSVVQLSW